MRELTQRQLRNESGAVMRGLDDGEEFLITRNGVPVGELRPIRARRRVSADRVAATFAGAGPIDRERFRDDIDSLIDQELDPRG